MSTIAMQRYAKCNFLVWLVVITFVKQINLSCGVMISSDNEEAQACSFYDTKNITSGHEQPDGSWFHDGISYPVGHYMTYNFIKQNGSTIKVPPHVRGCYCLQRPCISACCEVDKIINWENGNGDGICYESDEKYKEVLWEVGITKPQIENILSVFHWKFSRPDCQLYFLNKEWEQDRWKLLENGSIYIEAYNEVPTEEEYCLGIAQNEQENKPEVVVLKCLQESEPEVRFSILPIGMLISVPFLLVTFIVYALIPELRNVHGKSLMCYVFGLTLAYILLAFVQLFTNNISCRNGLECLHKTLCATFGYIIYFAFMVSFFWLNVMCFDIFWTFRSGIQGGISARHKFRLYCLYGWGMPVLLTLLSLLLQHTQIVTEEYRPNIGDKACFFDPDMRQVEFIYLYSILLVLIVANIMFFIVTAFRIVKVQKETLAVTTEGNSAKHSRHSYEKFRFWLYLRLFLIMGVTWSLELVSWAVAPNSNWFYITDFYNCIQGILIFLLVVWNHKVKKLVIRRYRKFRGFTEPEAEATRSSRFSSRSANTQSVNLKPLYQGAEHSQLLN